MIERGLEPDFSPAALAEVERSRAHGPVAPGAARDLRHLPWASIDNDDSLDLDQLSVASRLPNGAFRVLVAIADVGGLVGKGSAVDDHARANTTSVYTAAEIFPMLPEGLSNDLTSLADARDRGAVVVEMTVADDGTVTAADQFSAVSLSSKAPRCMSLIETSRRSPIVLRRPWSSSKRMLRDSMPRRRSSS